MPAAKKPAPAPATNLAAARSGDRRAALVVARDTIARAMDECDPNMLPQLAGQYRATLAELAALPTAEVVSKRDELRARRDARAKDRGAAARKAASSG